MYFDIFPGLQASKKKNTTSNQPRQGIWVLSELILGEGWLLFRLKLLFISKCRLLHLPVWKAPTSHKGFSFL